MSRLARVVAAFRSPAPATVVVPRRHRAPRPSVRSWDNIGTMLGRETDGVASAIVRGDITGLRKQARELELSSPLVARYVRVAIENEWGPDGITLQAVPSRTRGDAVNTVLARANEAAFYEWAADCMVDGGSLDEGMAWLITRRRIDGEAAFEIVRGSRYRFGVALRKIDADLIDETYSVARKAGQLAVVRGVELDDNQRPVAYYVLSHRASQTMQYGAVTRRRVAASDMIVQKHGDEVRGVTPLAPVLARLNDLNKLQEAVIAQHRAAACKMGFIETTIDGENIDADPGATMATFDAASGVIEQLPAGAKFTAWEPGSPGAQYAEIYSKCVHEFAAAVGVTYVSLTGDLRDANYSSMRQGELQARDAYRVWHNYHAGTLLQRVYDAVLRGAQITGAVLSPLPFDALSRAVWHGRTWPWVDPLKDAAAIRELLALGLTTRTRELNALGMAAADVFQELSDEIATLKTLGIPTEITSVQASVASADAAASRPRLTA